MEKVEYKDKVINMIDKTVVLENVFAHYDEENEVYWVSDNLYVDDGETKVDISFTTDKTGKPFGYIFNSYFRKEYETLTDNIPLKDAYKNYKDTLFMNIINDKNECFEDYKSLTKKFIALRNRKNGKENE